MSERRLTILGLGPGDPRMRTREADEALTLASRIILRTGVHPGVAPLIADPRVQTCDDLYERAASFTAVYDAIVERVWSALRTEDVVYAVPGHPLAGERASRMLLERAGERGVEVRLVAGIGALDAISTALRIDPMDAQPQILDAVGLHEFVQRDPYNGWFPDCSPLRPVVVLQVYSRAIASSVKLALGRVFPEDHELVIVAGAGVPGQERLDRRKLFELDRTPLDHLTSLWVPPLDELAATRWPLTLARVSARLRAPNGCPWDREQTHASLRWAVIEEAYEVADAIDAHDPHHLAEELGDLLLQVALHAQIAEEAGTFAIGDVYDHVNRKLVRRHPHVFGEGIADTPEAVVATWDGVKAQERAAVGKPAVDHADPLDRLPRSMPMLTRLTGVLRHRGAGGGSASSLDREEIGADLLANVRKLVELGADPESELERAYRSWNAESEGRTAVGIASDAEAPGRERNE